MRRSCCTPVFRAHAHISPCTSNTTSSSPCPALYHLAFVSSAVCRMRIIRRKVPTYDQARAVSSLPFACVAAGFLAVSGVSLTHDYAFRYAASVTIGSPSGSLRKPENYYLSRQGDIDAPVTGMRFCRFFPSHWLVQHCIRNRRVSTNEIGQVKHVFCLTLTYNSLCSEDINATDAVS
jgi:hypothetical protein